MSEFLQDKLSEEKNYIPYRDFNVTQKECGNCEHRKRELRLNVYLRERSMKIIGFMGEGLSWTVHKIYSPNWGSFQ